MTSEHDWGGPDTLREASEECAEAGHHYNRHGQCTRCQEWADEFRLPQELDDPYDQHRGN